MSKKEKSLYENKHPNKSLKGTGYATKDKALFTLELIKNYDLIYQKQIVITMYNRAKYHPHQTKTMKEAMEVFNEWLEKHK